mgnify:CR=1 FL=1
MNLLAKVFVNYNAPLPSMHDSTVSHCDARLASKSWEVSLKTMGIKFLPNTTFHP